MKRYYLLYNDLCNQYFLSEGKSESQLHRVNYFDNVGIENLTEKLRSNINSKKKALIHLMGVPKDGEIKIRNLFRDTKVEII